jgi:hypothetical protein
LRIGKVQDRKGAEMVVVTSSLSNQGADLVEGPDIKRPRLASLLLNPFSPIVNLISGFHEFIFSGFPDNPILGNKEFMITRIHEFMK